jgi:carboxymethylenebutenolidase
MEIATATLELETPDGPMEVYEARPQGAAAHPAIVVLMEAFGLNRHIKSVTERIAREGYVAAAPDLYHREPERVVPYGELEKAIGIMNRLRDAKVMDDVGALLGHLRSQAYVQSGKLGITGFCMGGRFTYLAAAHHGRDLKAAVAFYGGGIPAGKPSPLERTPEIGCPIYLFFGAKDPLIPQEHVAAIRQALTEHKKDFAVQVYPEAGHGFFCDDRQSYHEPSAKDAWEKFKDFFARHLK